jgi:hypothetical protein
MLTLDNEVASLFNSGWLDPTQFTKDPVTGKVTLITGGTTQNVVFTAASTPAALAAGNNNNFALPANVSRIRFSANAAGSTLTGLGAGADGQVIVVTNISANDLTLSPEDALSLAANRFAINGTQILGANQSLAFMYDTGIARWSAWGV